MGSPHLLHHIMIAFRSATQPSPAQSHPCRAVEKLCLRLFRTQIDADADTDTRAIASHRPLRTSLVSFCMLHHPYYTSCLGTQKNLGPTWKIRRPARLWLDCVRSVQDLDMIPWSHPSHSHLTTRVPMDSCSSGSSPPATLIRRQRLMDL